LSLKFKSFALLKILFLLNQSHLYKATIILILFYHNLKFLQIAREKKYITVFKIKYSI